MRRFHNQSVADAVEGLENHHRSDFFVREFDATATDAILDDLARLKDREDIADREAIVRSPVHDNDLVLPDLRYTVDHGNDPAIDRRARRARKEIQRYVDCRGEQPITNLCFSHRARDCDCRRIATTLQPAFGDDDAVMADQAVVVTDARYRSGAAPQTDALRARLRRVRLSEELRELEAEVIGARETARALLGGEGEVPDGLLLVDVAGTPALDPSAFDVPVIDRLEPPPLNPSLRVAAATVERAARRATLFEIAGRPDFMTSLQAGIRFGGREPFFTASIGIPLALWSGRKQTPLANAAILDLTAAEEEYLDLSALVTAEVRTRLADLEASRLRAQQIVAETIPLATATAASALQQYRVGAVEFTSVLETQDELFRVQLDLAQVVSRFGTRRAELAALAGEEWYR